MTPDEGDMFAQVSDSIDRFVELTSGAKAKWVAAGFTEQVAEAMACQIMVMIVAGANKAANG